MLHGIFKMSALELSHALARAQEIDATATAARIRERMAQIAPPGYRRAA